MVVIESLPESQLAEIRPLLIDLLHNEQERSVLNPLTRDQLERWLPATRASFEGQNRVFVAREDGGLVGFCWCVLFDPGTGLEGEVAELYVAPEARGKGIASELVGEVVRLFASERVTFACVWTNRSNGSAVAVYQRAGFQPTEQLVLTWYPQP